MNVIPPPIAGANVGGGICAGRGLGKLYLVVVCGVSLWLLNILTFDFKTTECTEDFPLFSAPSAPLR